MILGIINIGKYLELKVRARAASSLSALIKRVPRRAVRLEDGKPVEIGVDQVRPGDHLRVSAESYVPVDGTVVSGSGAVDVSMWTGEAVPVEVSAGDEVLGGSYVVSGALVVQARGNGSQSAIARIAELVEAAQASKTRMQRLADRVSAVFVPLVVAIAIVTFAGWMIWSDGDRLASAISAMIAVLVIACPCAMGLATPAAVMVATGSAALRGIIVRDAAVLEAAGACDVAVFDKTGTLTTGQLRIDSIDTAEGVDPSEVLHLAASAEQFSPHPIAKAIVDGADNPSALREPTTYKADAGLGVVATIDGRRVAVGSRRYLQSLGITSPEAASTAAVGTQVFVARDDAWIGTIILTDTLRPEAATAVQRLRMIGIQPMMVTGDAQPIAERIARAAGIERVLAGVSPEDKARFINELQSQGRRVLMVGDGINDAPALAAADVGIAMASGTEVATETAPITLVGNRLDRVPEAAELACRSVRIIRENLFWAFIYNMVAIPLAAFGVLPAGYAAAAMMFSDISVILNSLRLKYGTPT